MIRPFIYLFVSKADLCQKRCENKTILILPFTKPVNHLHFLPGNGICLCAYLHYLTTVV